MHLGDNRQENTMTLCVSGVDGEFCSVRCIFDQTLYKCYILKIKYSPL